MNLDGDQFVDSLVEFLGEMTTEIRGLRERVARLEAWKRACTDDGK